MINGFRCSARLSKNESFKVSGWINCLSSCINSEMQLSMFVDDALCDLTFLFPVIYFVKHAISETAVGVLF
jgi:hypothetical protein